MDHNKLYQYKDLGLQAPLSYAGTLAVKLTDEAGSQYNVSTPVNKAENFTASEDVIVLSNTMDGEDIMKFSFSFKVNKSVIGTGTRLILDMPGLFKVKAEAGTLWFYFPWEDAPAWKYVDASGLVDNWNTVALACDGTILSLTVNGTAHTLIDSSLQVEQTTYKGGQYKYLVLTETAPIQTADSWEINTIFKYNKSGSSSYPCWFGYSGGSDYKTPSLIWESGSLRLYLSSTGSSWDLNTENTGFIPEDGKTYALAAGFTGTEYYVKWKIRGAEEWAGQWTKASTTKAYCSVPFYFLNLSLNSSNYYNASEIYWTETNILINGSVWFGGRGATGKDFTNNDCVKSTFKEGPVLPSIKTGTLKTYQSWLYLKDIEAVKIADDSGGDDEEDKPIAKDPYDEIDYPIDTATVETYTSALSSGQALFTAVYDSVRLYLWGGNMYAKSPEETQYDTVEVYSGEPNSKKSIKAGLVGQIEGATESGEWVYRYRDNNADQTVEAELPRVKFLAWKE